RARRQLPQRPIAQAVVLGNAAMVATTNVIVGLPAVVSGLIEKLTPDWHGVTSRKFLLFIAISAVKKRCMCNGR
ncbi:hypothetical protein SB748_29975, partial [Rhizobium sp. SIMBA_035]